MRIEDAIAHYKQLEEEKRQEALAAAAPVAKPPSASAAANGTSAQPGPGTAPVAAKGLTNAQVVAMVKAGIDDDTVAQAVRAAKAVNFDLTAAGQQALIGDGVSATVVAVMKTRAARPHVASGTHVAAGTHPPATHAAPGHVAPQ
jgi:hypothetical protein